MEGKTKIIQLFLTNVKNKEIIIGKKTHGSEGHWLETQMGLPKNCKNMPDILGYEMKKDSKKITFGDFSASEYIFSKNKSILNKYNKWNGVSMTRSEFIRYFGSPNPKKHGRYSWSGSCVPTYGKYNDYGQKLICDRNGHVCIMYKYSRDLRMHDTTYDYLLRGKVMIAVWMQDKLKAHIERKFNENGFFICKKENNLYNKICFGNPFSFEYFIENLKNRNIIFDSGMYSGNNRNYSHFRSSGSRFWYRLVVEEYE